MNGGLAIWLNITVKFRAWKITFGTVKSQWFALPWSIPVGGFPVRPETVVFDRAGIVVVAKVQ